MRNTLLVMILALFIQKGNAQDTSAPSFNLNDESGSPITLPREHNGTDMGCDTE